MINANGKITVGGYGTISSVVTPYTMRVYGDEFVAQYSPSLTPSPAAGTPGTIDTNFGMSGIVSLTGDGQAASATPQVVLPVSNGDQYVAFSDGNIARFTNGNILDTTGAGGWPVSGLATPSNPGVYSMTMLANGGLLVAGTAPAVGLTPSFGWVEQYTTAGIPDPTFGSGTGIVNIGPNIIATVAVQQSMSRIVVAGQLASGNGALFGFTNAGVADATFAVGSAATGVLDTGIATPIYALVADQYDRLIIAYKSGSTVAINRYTSSGEIDRSFNSTGTILSAIPSFVDDATQVKVALNAAGNIVVAAHLSTSQIAVVAYDNVNGSTIPVIAQFAISGLTTPTLTDLITTADGKILISGNQSGSNNMWVARLVNNAGAFALDTTFNPNATAGTIQGIMQFTAGTPATVSSRNLTSIAIYPDGQITMVGTEITSAIPNNNPFMSRAYNNPYTTQEPLDLGAIAPGIVSATLGAGVAPNYVENGITFFATTDGTDQRARVIVLQAGNNNGVVVACDGLSTSSPTSSQIYINMFDQDGLLNTLFKPTTIGNCAPGQALVLGSYDNQYVVDMDAITIDGVSKAILAGYATNTALSLSGSLMIRYNLDPTNPGLDTTFGGFNGNPVGVAFGDAQTLNTIGEQSTGCIISTGLNYANDGIILRYTATGELDQTFGQSGMFVQGTTGIYTKFIDPQDRIVVGYNDGSNNMDIARILSDGSSLDQTFGTGGLVTDKITGLQAGVNINMRVAIDPSQNVIGFAVLSGGTSYSIARYTSAGVLSGEIATVLGTSFGGLTALVMTKMLVDTNGAVILIGYDHDGVDNVIVARMVWTGSGGSAHYILDPTFNAVDAVKNPNGTPGYVKYEVDGTANQVTTVGFIHPNGTIYVAGSQHS